jgi:hypothetical protein
MLCLKDTLAGHQNWPNHKTGSKILSFLIAYVFGGFLRKFLIVSLNLSFSEHFQREHPKIFT